MGTRAPNNESTRSRNVYAQIISVFEWGTFYFASPTVPLTNMKRFVGGKIPGFKCEREIASIAGSVRAALRNPYFWWIQNTNRERRRSDSFCCRPDLISGVNPNWNWTSLLHWKLSSSTLNSAGQTTLRWLCRASAPGLSIAVPVLLPPLEYVEWPAEFPSNTGIECRKRKRRNAADSFNYCLPCKLTIKSSHNKTMLNAVEARNYFGKV